jgi:site-specific recombinase XerD
MASPFLFTSDTGLPICRRRLDVLCKIYGKRADIPVEKRHFHVLKHSIATHLLDAGADIKFVQDWIGHKNIQNTVVYAQITNRARDEQAKKLFANPKIVTVYERREIRAAPSFGWPLYDKYCPVLAR